MRVGGCLGEEGNRRKNILGAQNKTSIEEGKTWCHGINWEF